MFTPIGSYTLGQVGDVGEGALQIFAQHDKFGAFAKRVFPFIALTDIAASTIYGKRGNKVASGLGAAATAVTGYATVTAFATLGQAIIPIPGLGAVIGGVVGAAVNIGMDKSIRRNVESAVTEFKDVGEYQKRMHFGGNYEDNEIAYTMRQKAAQEMGSSLLNSRQYLGKEGALLHQ